MPRLGDYGFVPSWLGNVYTGDFGLFVTSELTDKTSVLSEVVFEEGDAQSYKVDMRRVIAQIRLQGALEDVSWPPQTNIG